MPFLSRRATRVGSSAALFVPGGGGGGGNLLLQGKAFDNAVWTKLNCTVSANSTTDSDGGSLADTIIEAVDVAQVHRIYQDVTKAAGATSYDLSVKVKAATGSRRLALVLRSGDDANGVYCVLDYINTQVGVAATPFGSGWSGGTATVSSLGAGWLLCGLSGVTSDTGTIVRCDLQLDISSGTSALQNSYSGDGSGAHYLYDAILS